MNCKWHIEKINDQNYIIVDVDGIKDGAPFKFGGRGITLIDSFYNFYDNESDGFYGTIRDAIYFDKQESGEFDFCPAEEAEYKTDAEWDKCWNNHCIERGRNND